MPTYFASTLLDEEERDTSRYLSMTTIATFFSSVTATTLQTQLSLTNINSSTLNTAVSLCWFISLVFSVASGISGLVGMFWRRSSMWVWTEIPRASLSPCQSFYLILIRFDKFSRYCKHTAQVDSKVARILSIYIAFCFCGHLHHWPKSICLSLPSSEFRPLAIVRTILKQSILLRKNSSQLL